MVVLARVIGAPSILLAISAHHCAHPTQRVGVALLPGANGGGHDQIRAKQMPGISRCCYLVVGYAVGQYSSAWRAPRAHPADWAA
jgi:hypothetical protein